MVCPTCGHWNPYISARKGGRGRVLGPRPPRDESDQRHSIRVYWPLVGSSRVHLRKCPDPSHAPLRSRGWDSGPEPYDGLNRHDPEVSERRAAKARRHKALQSKERR